MQCERNGGIAAGAPEPASGPATAGDLHMSEAGGPLAYFLPLDDQLLPMNGLIGRQIEIRASERITCVGCGKSSNKSFNQGYCYRCFITLAACDLCIMKPETCHHHLGTCREPAWGDAHCMIPHVVYLANSTGVKVGITRETQIPTRWIDQGAGQALPIFRVATRRLSGLIETVLAQQVTDKTKWQALVKGEYAPVDLVAERDRLLALCADGLAAIETEFPGQVERLDAVPVTLSYPVETYAAKAKSFSPEKEPARGRLTGIKGQYLLFDTGVLNVRKFTGYEWEVTVL